MLSSKRPLYIKGTHFSAWPDVKEEYNIVKQLDLPIIIVHVYIVVFCLAKCYQCVFNRDQCWMKYNHILDIEVLHFISK